MGLYNLSSCTVQGTCKHFSFNASISLLAPSPVVDRKWLLLSRLSLEKRFPFNEPSPILFSVTTLFSIPPFPQLLVKLDFLVFANKSPEVSCSPKLKHNFSLEWSPEHPSESRSCWSGFKTPALQLTALDLRHGRFGKCPADGVEQKIGFLGRQAKVRSDSTLRGISFKVLSGKLEIPERICEFSALDAAIAGDTFLPLGLRTLLLLKAPETESSEELNKLKDTLGFFGFVATVPLRRVTKRPTDGGWSLGKNKTKHLTTAFFQ